MKVRIVLFIGCCSRLVFTSQGSVLGLFVMTQILLEGPLMNKDASLVFKPLLHKVAAANICFYY